MAEHRVRWSSKEKEILGKRASELLAGGARSRLEAVRQAQSVLPPSRRRTILHLGQAPWFKPSLPTAGADILGLSSPESAGAVREQLVDFFAGLLRDAIVRSGLASKSEKEGGPWTLRAFPRGPRTPVRSSPQAPPS